MDEKTTRYGFKFDEDTVTNLEVIRTYMKKKFGIDTDTNAVKAAIHYFANDIKSGKV